MGFGLIIAGLILLVNPIVHVVDLFPDFLGFFLIWKGLSKLAYLHSGFSSARDLFLRLSFVELIRSACLVFVPYTSGSTLVLFAFVFGVIELIFFIPAINYFFDGLNYVGMRYESNTVFAKKKGRKGREKELGTSLKRFTLVFYVIRVVATLIPELTELQLYEYLGTVSSMAVDYRRFKPLLYVLVGLVVVIVGLCWCIKLRYLNKIRKETDFIDRLSQIYERDVAPKTWVFMAKRMKTVLVLYVFAAVFSLCMDIDHINVLPGILSGVILSAAAILLAKDIKTAYAVIPLCAVRGAISIVNILLQKTYYIEDKFDEVAVQYVERAAEQYYRMSILQGIESAVAVASFVLFAVLLMKAVRKHLAETGTQNESVQYNKKNRDAEIAGIIRTKVIINQVLMAFNFAAAGLYLPLLLKLEPMVLIRSVVTVIWVLHTLHTVSHMNDALYTPLANDAV